MRRSCNTTCNSNFYCRAKTPSITTTDYVLLLFALADFRSLARKTLASLGFPSAEQFELLALHVGYHHRRGVLFDDFLFELQQLRRLGNLLALGHGFEVDEVLFLLCLFRPGPRVSGHYEVRIHNQSTTM